MSSSNRPPDLLFDHVVIVGVGLIGGSIARSLKQSSPATRITGLGRNRERLLLAQSAGVIDDVATTQAEIQAFDLAVVCTPVDRIVDDVRSLDAVSRAGALITDAGSVKGAICQSLANVDRFIGSHPMAGSEKGGWENSHAGLFRGKTCVLTPAGQSRERIDRVGSFWNHLGMQVCEMPPRQHDQLVALTSHLPHALAAVLASMLSDAAAPLASTGFRDTTRVASGDPQLWTSIFESNREAVSQQVREFIHRLTQFQEALGNHRGDQLRETLTQGQVRRDQWLSQRPDLQPPTGPAS